MGYDKKTFLKNVTIICDTREQKNSHILSRLDEMGIAYKHESLDFGDYSFVVAEKVKDGTKTRNFTQSCLIERKANVNELYGNLTIDRERIEKEFLCGSSLSNEFTLLIEGVSNFDELYEYELPEWQMLSVLAICRAVLALPRILVSRCTAWRGMPRRMACAVVKTPSDAESSFMMER